MSAACGVLDMPELQIRTDPILMYSFNGRMLVDPEFRAEFARDPGTTLNQFGIDVDPAAFRSTPRGLTGDERALLDRLTRMVEKQGLTAQRDVELAMADAGYLQPAIAALVLVVAVAVAVVVVLVAL